MRMNKIILVQRFIFTFCLIISRPLAAMMLNGPITANGVIVTGNVTVSSITVSYVDNYKLDCRERNKQWWSCRILQTVFSSSTVSNGTASSTLTGIPGMSVSLTLMNANDYVRISLSGLFTAVNGSDLRPHAVLSIERDSTDLGQGALITTDNVVAIPVGITIIDSPGDTMQHTYQATYAADSAGWHCIFYGKSC